MSRNFAETRPALSLDGDPAPSSAAMTDAQRSVLWCPKFLGLLHRFYAAHAEQPPLEAALLPPDEIPAPYRGLLVHRSDMTSTLQRHHGETVVLRVLDRKVADGELARHIVLEGARTRRPVEYGAARIRLDALDEGARREVLECRVPLGGILARHGVAFGCCPGGYFRVRSNALIERALGLARPEWLYGRCNCLADGDGATIAEVVEILPPER